MNPDNPYAAPQTLETIANKAVGLPLAEEQPDPFMRLRFAEIDTPSLTRIEAASRAIRRMTVVWTLGVAVLLIGFIVVTMSGGAFGPIWLSIIAGIVVLTFRVLAGVERGSSQRYYSLLVDFASCLAILYSFYHEWIQWAHGRPFPTELPYSAVMALVLLSFPVTSVLAHWRYGRLFGDEQLMHEELARELAHRRRYRIP